MPPFVSGLALSRSFYTEAVRPILAAEFPSIAYAAALIGTGSEVLGYDSARSTDHHWGPRVLLLVGAAELSRAAEITKVLAHSLPPQFLGYSTNFAPPEDNGVRRPESVAPGEPIAHRVEIFEPSGYFRTALGFDPLGVISTGDWLMTPSQSLLEATAGEVFHDGPGQLTDARARLAWYPHEIWLYIMSCQWQCIAEEEAFAGRCAEAGDEIGSRIVAARIARDLIRLAFLIARQYAPYSKWLGTAFATLDCAARLAPSIARALEAQTYTERERALCDAYEIVARMHNALGVTAALDSAPRFYYGRPYRVIDAGRFAAALRLAITDGAIRQLPERGAIDQFVDSTAAPGADDFRAALQQAP